MYNQPRSYDDILRSGQTEMNWIYTGADPSPATNITDPTANNQQAGCDDGGLEGGFCSGYYNWLEERDAEDDDFEEEFEDILRQHNAKRYYPTPFGEPLPSPLVRRLRTAHLLGDLPVMVSTDSDQPRADAPETWNVNQFTTIGTGAVAKGGDGYACLGEGSAGLCVWLEKDTTGQTLYTTAAACEANCGRATSPTLTSTRGGLIPTPRARGYQPGGVL